MDLSTYEIEDRVEAGHWWFTVRRSLFMRLLRRWAFRKDAEVLDVGTSTGTNLRMLRDAGFTQVRGLDFSASAAAYCHAKGLGPVHVGSVCAMPFPDASFDLVLATDVIEHIDDDGLALTEIVRVLRPGGKALITVPAFPSLWGVQDDISHHRRRYRKRPLIRAIAAAGLEVRTSFHFNFLLFLPIWGARTLIRILRLPVRNENEVNMGMLNAALGMVFALDTLVAPWLHPPFGVSIAVIGERPAGSPP